MVPPGDSSAGAVTLTLLDDLAGRQWHVDVTPGLARLVAFADGWARAAPRPESHTLSFSSTLAALIDCDHALSAWFRQHLALRGSPREAVTGDRAVTHADAPPARLLTTVSFRRALAQAQELAGGRLLDVKHLMAAYPVVKEYHAGDFLRYRIDRRAWCLALADHLGRTEPSAERAEWAAYARLAPEVLLPHYRPDLPAGADLLGVGREVEAFAMLIASARTEMPISVGVFGPWGSGKSYFMNAVERRVAALSRTGGAGSPYLARVAQVRFNAWHYSEGDVVASLVDQIFRNLRFGERESEVVLLQRRADLAAAVASADTALHAVQARAEQATALESALQQRWQQLSAEQAARTQALADDLQAARTGVAAAEQRIAAALAAEREEIAVARRRAPVVTAATMFGDAVLADPRVAPIKADFDRLRQEARWLGGHAVTIAWGTAAVALAFLAALAADRVGASRLVTAVTTVLAAVAPLAAAGASVLRALAARGAELERRVLQQADAAAADVEARWRASLDTLETTLTASRERVAALTAEMAALDAALRKSQADVAAAERERRDVADQLAAARTAADDARRRLDSLSPASLLGETIADAAANDAFRSRLGALSIARSYFQRLSEAMRQARADAAATGQAPVVERIVLYVDDLDRCPEEKVRDVLRAVHLLLAFDLFACVVAVDPRWILQCLEESAGVRRPRQSGAAATLDADLDLLGGYATPSDYLEKIFQVPLWLRPVAPDRRAALASTLLGPDLDGPFPSATSSSVDADAAAGAGTADGARATSPPPALVTITAGEVEFLQTRLMPLLNGNARALKRFVNAYQLVKAALTDVEAVAFDLASAPAGQAEGVTGDSTVHRVVAEQPYRICMAQLALLSTDRDRARVLARLIDEAPRTDALGTWLSGLSGAAPERGSIARDLSSALLPQLEALPVDRFAFWFERTRRYSFYL